MQRDQVRIEYRNKRQALSVQEQTSAAQNILTTCLASTNLIQAKVVACYMANDGEIDPKAIIDYCWSQGKTVLLPVLHPFSKGHLLFVEYHPKSVTRKNNFGIAEPVVTSQNIYPLQDIQLLFTPLVAFDSSGNRLGMGGGFYDRTLAPIRRDSMPVHLIGLAHNCQQTSLLPTDNWDIPLDGIATPTQFFNIS